MSQYNDGLLHVGDCQHFNRRTIHNERSKTIEPAVFGQWTRNHMYQTTYSQHHGKGLVQHKNTAIPGYTGYVPSVKADNFHAKTFTKAAKESFSQEKLGQNPYGLSTTGFNINREALIDRTKAATSSKYGKTAIQKAHPCWNTNLWQSTSQDHFRDPRKITSPTFRPTDKNSETWKPMTKNSGFSRNNDLFDGYGWKSSAALQGDNKRTQYRDRYDQVHPFHRDVNISKPPKLQKKQLNYHFN